VPEALIEDRVEAFALDRPRNGPASTALVQGREQVADALGDDLASVVLLAGHLLELRLDQALRPEGLTARQLRALRYIAVTPHVTRGELAAVLCTSRQAAGGIAQRLHAIRLIDKTGAGPGLPVAFEVTELGRQCLLRARAVVADTERAVTAQLSTSTLESFTRLLRELIVAAK
jgi:DNA-binding MarR family transcriptional regulator